MSDPLSEFETDSSQSKSPPRKFPWTKLWIAMALVLGVLWLREQAFKARTAARMSSSKNNLKQIGLALHNYHDVYSQLPPSAIVDENGTLYHGWGFSLMPYLECNSLYDKIDQNLPWNNSVNVDHFKTEIPVYLNPGVTETMCEDGFGYSHYAGNSRILKPNGSPAFDEIKDGTSHTILAGEINAGFVAWGTPINTRDPAKGLNKGPETFGSPYLSGVQFLLVDGSVQLLSHDIDLTVLKALATPNGGESVKLP